MIYKKTDHSRQSIRIPGFDYSQAGQYFITICTKDRQNFLGNIRNGKMYLSKIGNIVNKCWLQITKHYPNTELDEYIIMPNHLHGIIEIPVGVENFQPLQFNKINHFQKIIPRSIGCIIRGFKIGVTKLCKANNPNNQIWQRNYYEHIISDDDSLENIHYYIRENVREWKNDIENITGQQKQRKFDKKRKPMF